MGTERSRSADGPGEDRPPIANVPFPSPPPPIVRRSSTFTTPPRPPSPPPPTTTRTPCPLMCSFCLSGGAWALGGGRRAARIASRGQKRWKERMNEVLRVIRRVIREQLMATPTRTVTPRKITIRGHTGMGPHTGMGGDDHARVYIWFPLIFFGLG